ncbi:class I tRNA ligase family protein [Flindersiella endophytica]
METHRYTGVSAGSIEARWQRYWREHETFYAERRDDKPKFFVLDMFIGPSGAMHVGHPLGYVATDVYGRYLRMRGFNVLHAFGFDAFGLPAEQYAVQTGQHPAITTKRNIDTIRAQLRRLGQAYDPRREIATTDVSYYRWTQWMFLQIFNSWYDDEQRRARPIAELESEYAQGIRATPDGRAWAGMSRAEQRKAIDDRRLAYVAEAEVNWCPGLGTVLANEEVTADGRSERGNYPVFRKTLRQWMLRITAYAGRLAEDLDQLDWPEPVKTQQRNWIPDMHDWLFSRQRYWGEPFPIVYDEHGPIALPDSMLPVELPETDDFSPTTYDPDDSESAPEAPLSRLTEWTTVTLDLGDGPKEYRRETNTMPQWAGSCWYEMRYLDPGNADTFCSPENESYWMPADLYVGGVGHTVLHLLYARFWHKVLYDLGHVTTGEPYHKLVNNGDILAHVFADERGVYVPADEVDERDGVFSWHGKPVTHSIGKMGKSLRNSVSPDDMCDQYGADSFRVYEMSMGPLQVSRPWDPSGIVGSHRFLQRVWRIVVDERTGDVRVSGAPAAAGTLRLLHRTIETVRSDLDELAFNTAIARLIEFANHLTSLEGAPPRDVVESLILLLAPFAPHLAEELWQRLGHADSLAYQPYPEADPAYLVEEQVTCVIQVDGKLRGRIDVSPSISEDELRRLALASSSIQQMLDGRPVRRVVVRAPRLVNVVLA